MSSRFLCTSPDGKRIDDHDNERLKKKSNWVEQKLTQLTDEYDIPTKFGRDEQIMPTNTELMPTKW